MASNPIQRKTRNAALLGAVVTLLITVFIMFILYLTVFQNAFSQGINKGKKTLTTAYRLISSIESGETITSNKVEKVEFYLEDLPENYINSDDVFLYKSKLNLKAGTILNESLIYKDETEIANSTKLIEYNMLTLPSSIKAGDYVDVRFMLPSGQDYIVLAKKEVKSLKETTVAFYLTEDEILMMSSAIIESYAMGGTNLYITKYVEVGMQNSISPTYSVNADVYQLIMTNSEKGINIEDYAKINKSYSTELRNTIERELAQYEDKRMDNIEEGVKKQKEDALTLYLSGLSAEY